ncbi:hypothetical protein [Tropicimonas sp. S265A]|uniref:hypothetical protein n=1 Tax=Tropicimonas sp. S265A TaxID=3415134 RepID=UPI003C7CACA4
MRKQRENGTLGEDMAAQQQEQKALALLNAFEKAGKTVCRVIVEGRRIELELAQPSDDEDEFAGIDMQHGKA